MVKHTDPADVASTRIGDFLEWAQHNIGVVISTDLTSGTMYVEKMSRTQPIPVHFKDSDWRDFVTWFAAAEGIVETKTPTALFRLLADYLEQGIYQSSTVQSLALFEFGIWPEDWRTKNASHSE